MRVGGIGVRLERRSLGEAVFDFTKRSQKYVPEDQQEAGSRYGSLRRRHEFDPFVPSASTITLTYVPLLGTLYYCD
jgi:hypothetical protein